MNRVIIPIFLIAFALTVIGAVMKIMHQPGADTLMMVSLVAFAIFIALAIYEVVSSPAFSRSEKVMWVVALIFFSGIAGLIYLLAGRRHLRRPSLR